MLKLTWRRVAGWPLRQHHLKERAPAGSMLAEDTRKARKLLVRSVRLVPAFDQ